eukprot:scaffold680789_cov94-Prasinocladus_malaysianus.AAC.1
MPCMDLKHVCAASTDRHIAEFPLCMGAVVRHLLGLVVHQSVPGASHDVARGVQAAGRPRRRGLVAAERAGKGLVQSGPGFAASFSQ